ncbi:MAG: PTS system mannose/fructose/sorbose family transporter subunit IID [Gemmatimonadetes bacterium]|nr:PTS system mannose/fructose/sorbose family transporter subunit IID [Gemmatimonadota bacterium]
MTPAPTLPFGTWLHVFVRLFAVQGSYNYEAMIGNGIAYAAEPALRRLPGGRGGDAYRAAMARHSRYFNAHPYLAALAVGALVRAELDGESPDRVERFRTACCGPLGAAGDRLVWAGWLPFCSALALLAYGLGATAAGVLLVFVGAYNVGHVALRVWGLRAGFREGLKVAAALGSPVLRAGPLHVARATAATAGAALPLVLMRELATPGAAFWVALAAAALLSVALARLQSRVDGWRVGVAVLLVFFIYSVVR